MNLTDRFTKLMDNAPKVTKLEEDYKLLSAVYDKILHDISSSDNKYKQYKDEIAEIIANIKAELIKQDDAIRGLKSDHDSLAAAIQAINENQNILQDNIKHLNETIEILK